MVKYLGGFKDTAEYIGKFVNQLKGEDYIPALHRCRDCFNEIEIDRLRVKPIVKITGEFWAQTTEGDGNFNMFNFLQREGAQVLVEPIGTWIMYMIHQVVQKYKDFKGLEEGAVLPPLWRLDKRAKIEWSFRNKVAKLKLAEAIFKNEYHKIVGALGDIAHHLADQYELQRLGHPFYNSRAGGGEGHLEVAKNIYYSNKDLAHMVLSVKPFGCMPSTQSDGAQSAVVSNYKDMIYLPVETSGEGEINAHSRVQMALGEAKNKAKKEMAEALERTGLTLDDCRAWVEAHPETKRPLYHVPHTKGIVGGRRISCSTSRERMKTKAHRASHEREEALAVRTTRSHHGQTIPHRNGRRLDHRESGGHRRGHRPDLWSDYQRHDTKQPEKVLEFLQAVRNRNRRLRAATVRACSSPARAATDMPKFLGAKFVQEVNAVSLAVEKLYPECGSVIELGGQDAKIIIFKKDPETGRKKKMPSMNDKCAGGTGAVIDKINAKLRIPAEQLCQMGYKGVKLHPVAGKCGVFAETDINGLQKMGVPPDELMASLFEAIVMQNL